MVVYDSVEKTLPIQTDSSSLEGLPARLQALPPFLDGWTMDEDGNVDGRV